MSHLSSLNCVVMKRDKRHYILRDGRDVLGDAIYQECDLRDGDKDTFMRLTPA